jgi:hypothetical protein
MSIKDLIIQELNQLPEALLPKVLDSIRQIKESEQENEEVYWQLANS